MPRKDLNFRAFISFVRQAAFYPGTMYLLSRWYTRRVAKLLRNAIYLLINVDLGARFPLRPTLRRPIDIQCIWKRTYQSTDARFRLLNAFLKVNGSRGPVRHGREARYSRLEMVST